LNHFFNVNEIKIFKKNLLKFEGILGVVGKPESDLIEFISQFSELRYGRY
jgi:hypothetical protein